MKKGLIILFLLTMAVEINAQQKPRFSTQNSVGLLFGGSDNAPQVQTVNGIAYRNWFAGIGTGIDWYFSGAYRFFYQGTVFLTWVSAVSFSWLQEPGPIFHGGIQVNSFQMAGHLMAVVISRVFT